jgi:uncharacterized protein (DUF1684 family)
MKICTKAILSMSLFLWMLGMMIPPNLKPQSGEEEQTFILKEQTWRAKRDKEMRSPVSWLNIAGLFWLKEGENRFGTSTSNSIKLPKDSAPPFAGNFILESKTVTVTAEIGVEFKFKGNIIHKMILKGDDTGKPDVIALNNLRMWVIKRFDRYAIRLRDLNHAPFKNYTHLDFFPPTEKFKLEAEFHPFPEPKQVELGTVIGENTEMNSPGYVTFTLDGKEYRLDAFSKEPKKLFFIFGDETNGRETYEASRFMDADILEKGKVDLNFNRAYNPPCAYTPHATCPLPHPQNQLKTRILAGEKKYPDSHHKEEGHHG